PVQHIPMPEPYAELASALRERLALINDETSRREVDQHMARLQKVSERITHLEALLPAPIDPQLRHFLEKRSYSKALDYLEAKAD
ncbi:MAG: hypothetical protein M3Y03_03735, partial [Verrucomicrobiota bacterium]|nr:hypothetical protein [Verrucomicrobiota bacterium]